MTFDDYFEIQQVCARFAFVVDERAWERLAEIFTDEAELDRAAYGLPPLRGHAAIAESLERLPRIVHLGANLEVTSAEEDRVETRSRFIGVGPSGTMTGEYRDVWRKTPDGWRIACRAALPAGG
jgi:hypothetical protein